MQSLSFLADDVLFNFRAVSAIAVLVLVPPPHSPFLDLCDSNTCALAWCRLLPVAVAAPQTRF